jgi:hypothetical protein
MELMKAVWRVATKVGFAVWVGMVVLYFGVKLLEPHCMDKGEGPWCPEWVQNDK